MSVPCFLRMTSVSSMSVLLWFGERQRRILGQSVVLEMLVIEMD